MKGAVWGATMERARLKLWKIVEDYEKIGIKPIKRVNSISSAWVEFDNGDYWKAIGAHDSARGNSINISYIDHAISEDVVNCIIKPCTKAYPFQAINYYWTEGIEEIE